MGVTGALEGVVEYPCGSWVDRENGSNKQKKFAEAGTKLGEAPTASSHARWIPRVMDSGGVGLRGWCPSKNQ